MSYAVGIDVGGSSVKAVAVTPEGDVQSQSNRPFEPTEPLAFARTVRDVLREVFALHGEALEAVGVSAPGLAAKDERSIAFMPGRLGGIEGLDWTDYLGAPFRVPVLNDAHAALLGEVWQGAAQGVANVFMLTLGTGVGGAAMVDGRLLKGAIGRAGHLGHICLDPDGPKDICNLPGSLEHAIGNYSLTERAQGRFATTHDLARAVAGGDSFAGEVWDRSVRRLALGVASLINVLDPERVIIGGGIAEAGATLLEPLRRHLAEYEWRPGGRSVVLVQPALGEYAGAMGSAWNALQHVP
ncbi:MAG: ROK family protein [Verrucomicrobiales bacterium]|nr:ROK family protein [Verrucomicrobiales bacterium]